MKLFETVSLTGTMHRKCRYPSSRLFAKHSAVYWFMRGSTTQGAARKRCLKAGLIGLVLAELSWQTLISLQRKKSHGSCEFTWKLWTCRKCGVLLKSRNLANFVSRIIDISNGFTMFLNLGARSQKYRIPVFISSMLRCSRFPFVEFEKIQENA